MTDVELVIKSGDYTILCNETKKLVFERVKETYSDIRLDALLDKILPLQQELKDYLEGKG